MLPIVAHGQTAEPDSLSVKELGEITVVADAQRTGATKTVYLPNRNQKSTASDGISLLSRMGIPQLSVNPITESVRTADNQAVNMFINYHPATAEEVGGLKPNDVKTVEYLDFPIDPRFGRSPHVINFITHSHSYGGYTKINGKEQFMIHRGEASFYSKFAYRKMEYDLMASGDYDNNSHIGSSSNETYCLKPETIHRESGTETGRYRQRSLISALRASWHKNDNFSFRNLISYRRTNTPECHTSGFVNFSDRYNSETYHSASPSANNALGWDSELYAAPGKGWSVNGSFQAEFIHNTTTSNYAAGTESIENHAREGAWSLRGTAQANKSLSDKITLFTSILSGGGHTKIDYTGTSDATNRFRQAFTGVYLGVALNYRKVSGSIDGGYAFESNYINGKTMKEQYPFTHINLQYAPSQKSSFSLWFQYASMSPDATMKNPNIIQQSELMYISGNPDLDCSRHLSANISYTFLPGNTWQMSAYAVMFRIINRQIAVYTPDGPHETMLKKYQNNGDYNHGQIGVNLTGRFFNGKLTVSASPKLLLYKTTGTNSVTHYPLMASINANYYLGEFFFNAYWNSSSSYVDGETCFLRKMPSDYSAGAGWAHRGWNIQLSLVNIFRTSWQISHDVVNTPFYSNTMAQFGPDSHRRISLSITYTVNYGGKKLNHNNEISKQRATGSAILK